MVAHLGVPCFYEGAAASAPLHFLSHASRGSGAVVGGRLGGPLAVGVICCAVIIVEVISEL